MTRDEILKKHEDDNEYHFCQVDREWIMEAMQEYTDQQLRIVSNSLPTIECERCNKLATHKANLLEENHKLRQRLIDAGLEQPAIRNEIRG